MLYMFTLMLYGFSQLLCHAFLQIMLTIFRSSYLLNIGIAFQLLFMAQTQSESLKLG